MSPPIDWRRGSNVHICRGSCCCSAGVGKLGLDFLVEMSLETRRNMEVESPKLQPKAPKSSRICLECSCLYVPHHHHGPNWKWTLLRNGLSKLRLGGGPIFLFCCLLLKTGERNDMFFEFHRNVLDKWFGQGIVFNINLCRIKDNFATGRGVERVSIKNLRMWFEFLVLNLGVCGKSMQSNATTHGFWKCCRITGGFEVTMVSWHNLWTFWRIG